MEYFLDFPPLTFGVGVERLGVQAAPSISWGKGGLLGNPGNHAGYVYRLLRRGGLAWLEGRGRNRRNNLCWARRTIRALVLKIGRVL